MKTWILIVAATAMGCGSGSNGNDMSMPSDMATATTPTCAAYCSAVMTNCTGATMSIDGGTGLADYPSMDSCMNACAKFPVGAISDQSGNTLGCRLYHANLAAGSSANAMTHCPHASLSGGGVCGDRCANFCALATAICTTKDGVTMPVFSSATDCMSKCGKAPFAFNMSAPEMVTDSPTLNCAFYHLSEAFANPYDVDAGTAATNSSAGGHCDDFNPNNPDRGCQ